MGVGSPFSPPGLSHPRTKNSPGAGHEDWLLWTATCREASGVLDKSIGTSIVIYTLMVRKILLLYAPLTSPYERRLRPGPVLQKIKIKITIKINKYEYSNVGGVKLVLKVISTCVH